MYQTCHKSFRDSSTKLQVCYQRRIGYTEIQAALPIQRSRKTSTVR